MGRLVRDAVFGGVPYLLSEQVMKTIEVDGSRSGLIHFAFCLLLIELVAQLIRGMK